jgi:GntR family transcriptional regulator
MITRNPSLTDQVKAHIKERIVNNGFENGRIPPEADLAVDLGVSRTTVRDALSRLEHEGTIFRRQGAGTFVNPPGLQIRSRLEEIWSYEQVLENHGYTPVVQVLSAEEMPACAETAGALNLDEGAPVFTIEKLFLEGRTPVMMTVNHIPTGIVSASEYPEGDTAPIYEFLEDHCDRTLGYYLSEIIPVTLDAGVAGKLGVEAGTVAISFDEIGYDQNNEPVVKATSYFRDDLLRFRLIRRRSGA